MTWTHIKRHLGMGLEEQWVFKPGVAPLCSLKKSTEGWGASLLHKSGISTTQIDISSAWTLEQAQRICETTLKGMGHEWPYSPRKTQQKKEAAGWFKRSWQ